MDEEINCAINMLDSPFSLLSWFKAQKVNDAKVLVAGAGALGNEVLKNLALFGVGHIVIVDYDTIEQSNLSRSILFRPDDADKGLLKAEVAARRIKEINPEIRVLPVCGNLMTDVGLGLYRRMDVVIGCLDNLLSRILLNRLCYRVGKTWIDGGIGDLEGQVSVYQPGKNCYECQLTEEEKMDFNKRVSCAGVAKMNEHVGRVATTPVSASIIAAVQAQEAMKMIHKEDIDSGVFSLLAGKLFAYEGMHPSFEIYDFSSDNPECTAHENWSPVLNAPELSADTPIHVALQMLGDLLDVFTVEINQRNNTFVDKISSRKGNLNFFPMLPESKIPEYINQSVELRDMQVNEGFYQNRIENIDKSFPYPELTLKEVGIPYFDIIQATTEDGVFYVELSKDKEKYDRFFTT